MPSIGPYELYTIETGRFGLDGGAMFGIIPKPLWERKIAPDEKNRIPLHMRCLLLEGEGRLVLIDNGLGEKADAKFHGLYAVDQESANLRGSLRASGFAPEDVTDVILTHLHFDHCGGSTTRSGELVFPNARHHVQRSHWEWARRPNRREGASFLDENLDPIERSGQLRLADGPGELLPGVETIVVNGHTEGQQLIKISDGEQTLVFAADLLPTTAHIRDVWIMAYDVRPLVTLEEKQRFLDQAADEEWHLFFEHDPVTAVATVTSSDGTPSIVELRELDEL